LLSIGVSNAIRNIVIVKPANAPQSALGLTIPQFLISGNQANEVGFRVPKHRFPFFRNHGFLTPEIPLQPIIVIKHFKFNGFSNMKIW